MSRRVCETCVWWFAGEHEHGICTYWEHNTPYEACYSFMSPITAAGRIRMSDDTCKYWEHDEEDEHE